MSTTKIDLQTILQKQMSRKEFLRFAGAGIMGVVGITGALQSIQKLAQPTAAPGRQALTTQPRGYGSSPYGR